MSATTWQFFIDVGGTFTDVVACPPGGGLQTFKLLSSGGVRGRVDPASTTTKIVDPLRRGEPNDLWRGYTLRSSGGEAADTRTIRAFDGDTAALELDAPLPEVPQSGFGYELRSTEEAPIVAIRYLLGLRLDQDIGPVDVRLGTTRGTNALLERSGARVGFVTTKGFADILRIGNQDRPDLFELNIKKRDELAAWTAEIDERLSASGEILRPIDEAAARATLAALRQQGCDALAICLLHAHVNPDHELIVERIAREIGFAHVSRSSRVSRLEKIVSRGDTTVADAYLSPVIGDYLDALRQAMPQASIKLMTSAGGLVSADRVCGKDTVLSGPAGGVVGCAFVSRGVGFDSVIGFDMGGTSTDVCRIEPRLGGFEYQHETVKAGVRIMAPMLAIETVAAGGGSLCRFDGQKLVVGPKSAGADPGPACYGRGGPLTVTDMNVLLGRVVPAFFPFPLDRAAVEHKLDRLVDDIDAAIGSRLSPVDAADGFLQIANANMAAAIKRISVAKGYDLRDYVLTSFGGAGAQHACAIARRLGMSRVLCSPYAGVLSALGIGVADIKRIDQRTVDYPLCDDSLEALQPAFLEMTRHLEEALAQDGVGLDRLLPPSNSIDLCYVAQATLLTVGMTTAADARAAFERQHQQLYGYTHADRNIEIRAIRVELTAPSAHRDVRLPPADATPPNDARRTTMIIDGKPCDVPVVLRAELTTGARLTGPAVVIEQTSTIVIDADWEATVHESGDLILEQKTAAATASAVSQQVDPVQLELFNNQFAAIAEQMGSTLRRTALSTNVKERLDFSCAVFTPDGDLVVNAPHIPVHLGGMSDCVKCLKQDVGQFTSGEVFVTNDPYRGGSHLNDVTVITPVHDSAGERLLFIVASRAHHAEIGGTRPGSMPPDSTNLAEEGVLIRAFRWIRNGQAQHETMRALLASPPYPSRCPEENLADIAAQVAANQTGVRELYGMIERFGREVVHAYMHHIQDAAEAKMRAALHDLPDGVHSFVDTLDNGAAIRLAVTIDSGEARFDFSGTDGVLSGNLNANRAIVSSAVLYCLRCLIAEEIPLNAGILAPVEIVLPVCFLNPTCADDPSRSPAVVGGNVETSQRIVDTIFGALRVVAASQGTMNNLLLGDDSFGYYETICGGAGAGPGFDGADAVHTHMTNTRLTDPEVLESRYPVRLIRFAIRRGSGGAGLHQGGSGVIRELEFLRPLELSILSQRREKQPYGLDGGEPGAPGRNLLIRADAQADEQLGAVARASVSTGDRLIIETPGGGGWGRLVDDVS